MTELHKINVKLSEGQKRKLAKAYRDNEEISIKLAHKNLSGSDTLMVPKTPSIESLKVKDQVKEYR